MSFSGTDKLFKRIIKITGLFSLFILVAGVSAYFTLTLIIKSEDTVVVPNLIGKNVVNVLELLTDYGLNTKIKGSEYSTDIPKNHIIFQEPKPGAEIKKGRDVRIILSKGTKAILTPNLKGLSTQQTRIILEENSLCQGEISSIYSNEKKDEIIAQAPSAGTMITRGECVNILVSVGSRPRTYKMPDLKGLSLDAAIPLIENSDLVLGEIKSFFYENKPLNSILAHEPLSGHRVTEKSIASLVINRKPGQKNQEYLHGTKGVSLFRYRVENGFLKKRIRVRLDSRNFSNDLFDGLMKPGEEIWLLIPRNSSSTIFLYEDGELVKSQLYDAW